MHASKSEDFEWVRELYDELVFIIIVEIQEEGLISENDDPRQSPKVLAIVEELTRGLIKLRNTPP